MRGIKTTAASLNSIKSLLPMFMNLSFQIVPVFKKSRARSSLMRAGLQNKVVELVLVSPAEVFGTYTIASVVQNEVLGAIKEVAITGAAGGHQSGEITTSLFNATLTVNWKDFTTGKKILRHRSDAQLLGIRSLLVICR